jgi:hypothetical protein
MKSIAVFLLLNIICLSSFTGIANITRGAASCRISKSQKDCGRQKKSAGDDCGKAGCNAMLYCGTCGFVIAPTISLSPAVIDLDRKLIHHFIAGELSAYHVNDWNPPKA